LTQFSDLGLAAPLLQALEGEGYTTPTPIQAQSIPHILPGRDLLGIAQTGTGKTAAFALPMLQRLAADRKPLRARLCRALILSPTRELASQIADSFRTYGRNYKLRTETVFGGVSLGGQIRTLASGVDVLVATPGRLLDLINQRAVRLDAVEIFVLDEADRMLDMGFIHDIRKLVKQLPAERQNLFFSATMPQEIGRLAGELLRDPVRVEVTPVATTAEKIDQRVIMVETAAKRGALVDLIRAERPGRALVFTRTKHGADRVVRHLTESGIGAMAIHGNKSQGQRERALDSFRTGRAPILIATDIAARGIDVDGITHVINFDLPNIAESYVHRIGRTARAGAAGMAISFCAGEERAYLRDIEKLIRMAIPGSGSRAEEPRAEAPRRDGGRPRHAAGNGQQRKGGGQGQQRNGQHRRGDQRAKAAPRDEARQQQARPARPQPTGPGATPLKRRPEAQDASGLAGLSFLADRRG